MPESKTTHIGTQGDFSVEVTPTVFKTTLITFERAKMLAQTRRKRFNEFALGGFIAAIPGTAQTIVDFRADPTKIPQAGHLTEIANAIVFATLGVASFFHAGEPTSTVLLEELFPKTAKSTGFLNWVKSHFKQKNIEVG